MSPAQIKAREAKFRDYWKNMPSETSYEINNKRKKYVDNLPRME